jgi:hypothetical protein
MRDWKFITHFLLRWAVISIRYLAFRGVARLLSWELIHSSICPAGLLEIVFRLDINGPLSLT